MAKRYAYAAWAREQLETYSEERRAEVRKSYYSESGKIARYDQYKAYAKAKGFDYDNPPEGYWEAKEQPWHAPAGIAMGLGSILLWFLAGLIGGTTRR